MSKPVIITAIPPTTHMKPIAPIRLVLSIPFKSSFIAESSFRTENLVD
jgi:hypothetical protein